MKIKFKVCKSFEKYVERFLQDQILFLKNKATGNFLSYPNPDFFDLLFDPLNNTK